MHLPEDLCEGQSDLGKISLHSLSYPLLSIYSVSATTLRSFGASDPTDMMSTVNPGRKTDKKAGEHSEGTPHPGQMERRQCQGGLPRGHGWLCLPSEGKLMKLVKEAIVGSRERKQPVQTRKTETRKTVWSMWEGLSFGRAGVRGTREGATGHHRP